MYEPLDSFLNIDTWHTSHPNDEKRFYQALSEIVENEGFNADEMGEYMRAKTATSVARVDHPFALPIDRLVSNAWAVREYLVANSI